jgi:hypothetical protein
VGHHLTHDLSPAAEVANGKPATQDLPQAYQAWHHAEIFSRPAQGSAEVRHHFIEDQGDSALGSHLAQGLQELNLRRHNPQTKSGNRLDDHPTQLIGVLFDLLQGVFRVVERQDNEVLFYLRRYPGTVDVRQGRIRFSFHCQGADQDRVVLTMEITMT